MGSMDGERAEHTAGLFSSCDVAEFRPSFVIVRVLEYSYSIEKLLLP